MSYLNPLRLHFAGRFQAAVSTVNNDLTNFKTAYTTAPTDGSWNPSGDANWRLISCDVTAAWLADGSPAGASDPILQCMVADSDRQVAAKLVDLDPEQQLVSVIWGLEVRICTQTGETLVRGRFEPAPFIDIWNRAQTSGGDVRYGVKYQSVLTDLEWGDVEQSPFLKELQAAAQDGLLSIKFNVDGYNMNPDSPEFTRGRIVGTIGPASADEPHHLTLGRQFMPQSGGPINYPINFCVAVVDPKRRKIVLDLGNSLQTTVPGGPFANVGTLTLAYEQQPGGDQPSQWTPIDDIPYTQANWYPNTAGVVELPANRTLTDAELEGVAASPLALLTDTPGSPLTISEAPVWVRADQFVFRLSPGEQADVRLFATRFGHPYAGVQIELAFDPTYLQGDPQAGWPDPGTPTSALKLNSPVTAGQDGSAVAHIKASDPGNPRSGYIDGQVYGVRASTEETRAPDYPENPWNFISLLVWDAFTPDEPPTWFGSMKPILTQYGNLYPVMGRFLDLTNYDSICDNVDLLLLAFGLDPANPNYMPATRDLSPAKRSAVLRWLNEPGPDGKPLLGTPPPSLGAEAIEAAPAAEAVEDTTQQNLGGGKAAALSRRLALRSSGDNNS